MDWIEARGEEVRSQEWKVESGKWKSGFNQVKTLEVLPQRHRGHREITQRNYSVFSVPLW
jgi:hypothetical protein